ncbi:metallophosphoesterase family protein [Candidatus Gracilibacteria bacterium]|nr:metallophosphoesterase family protein [Candidatus Gracilibacteria bacterium]
MRIVIVSDIHSNLVALETVLAAAGSYDALWCLGDTIGYGPRPNECIALMRQHASIAITGNHDLACLDKLDLSDFNPDARRANIWNGQQLSAENRAWIEPLPALVRIDDRYTVVHGSPREPVWEYLLMPDQARINFALFDTQICFVGHSHVQLGFEIDHSARVRRFLPESGQTLELQTTRFFLNPGSVGQPRDQDARAAYAMLDTDTNTVRFQRVAYDIGKTQQQMQEAQLPLALIRRLEFGM